MSTGPSKRPASRDLTPPSAPATRPSSIHPHVTQCLDTLRQWPPDVLIQLLHGLFVNITQNVLKSNSTPEVKAATLDKCRRTTVAMVDRFDDRVFGPEPILPPTRAMCFKICRHLKPRSEMSTQTDPYDNTPPPPTASPSAAAGEDTESTMDTDPAPGTTRPTYAEAAVSTCDRAAKPNAEPKPGPNPRHPPTFKIPPTSRPKAQPVKAPVLNPVRLVVRPTSALFQQMPFAALLVAGPAEPFRLLSHSLSLSPTTARVTLLGVHQNRSKNLIVSLPHGTSDAHVDAVSTVIHSTYRPLCGFPLSVSRDVAWTKFMVSSVPARLKPGEPTFSEEEVRSSFLLNPAVKTLSITRPPRWIRNPASITGAHSSFTFSFQDPDGSLGRALAKSRLFVFGEPVHLKRWTDKPRRTRDIPQA
ncbi:hypothetical protein RhiJN_24587 [Ceratobasidium sp. AG-Ba]|nr:hypothetical protein RhiJN_24587 [Ceratobasidium sp. AG-Ba]